MNNSKEKVLTGSMCLSVVSGICFNKEAFSFYPSLGWGTNLTPHEALYHLGQSRAQWQNQTRMSTFPTGIPTRIPNLPLFPTPQGREIPPASPHL